MQIFSNTHYDFIKWRWHAIILSALVILAGAVMVVQRGLPLGIDFSGGTIVVYHFDKPVTEDAIRTAIESVPGEKVVQQYGKPDDHSIHEVLRASVRACTLPGGRRPRQEEMEIPANACAAFGPSVSCVI